MRKLGLIGGMSWISTHRYYNTISSIVRRRVDSRAAPHMAIESLDFSGIYRLNSDEEWAKAAEMVGDAAQRLADGGAEMIVIGANGLHKILPQVSDRMDAEFLHIAQCVGRKMADDGVKRAAVLGTRSVMTESFYRRQLVSHGIDLLPPDMDQVGQLDAIIHDELMAGKTTRDAERALRTMMHDCGREGAEAVVLANAELEMIVDVDATVMPVYDAMDVHAHAAADWLVGEG